MKNHFPKISIITVVYNSVKTLEYTIQSVINQNYKNIEYVVIDGGSEDGSLELLQRYQHGISILVSEKDNGIFHAMNKGLRMATGDWQLFLGADDLLLSPTIISELSPFFTNPDNIYYGNSYIKTLNRLYNGRVNKWSMALGNVSHQAIFYPKSVYKQKEYDESFRIFADHIYNIELFATHSQRFFYMPKLVSIYDGMGISSYSKDEKYDQNLIKIITDNYGTLCGLYVWLRRRIYRFQNKL